MTMSTFAPYRSLLFLSLGCVLSGGLIIYEWHMLNHNAAATTLPSKQPPILAMDRNSSDFSPLLPLSAYQAMVNSPLFFEGRKETVAVVESQDDGSLKLTGVVYTPNGYVALLQDKQGAHYKLNQGEAINGWQVGEVQKDRVALVRNTESLELTLFAVHNKRDLTTQDLEECFKNNANLPLEECFKHPDKYTHKTPGVTA